MGVPGGIRQAALGQFSADSQAAGVDGDRDRRRPAEQPGQADDGKFLADVEDRRVVERGTRRGVVDHVDVSIAGGRIGHMHIHRWPVRGERRGHLGARVDQGEAEGLVLVAGGAGGVAPGLVGSDGEHIAVGADAGLVEEQADLAVTQRNP